MNPPDPSRLGAAEGWTAAVLREHGWTGLRGAQAAARAARGQGNRPPRSGRVEYADIVRRNVLTLFNALVVPAGIALFLLGDYRSACSVSALAVLNTVLGLVQEVRAKRHLDRLVLLAEPRARVVRDGAAAVVPAGDVVLGDTLLLRGGEPVVADGPVLAAHFLEVDEALLTGESDPVPRRPGEPLLSGSYAVAGEGVYRAERVGAAAFAYATAQLARQYHHTASPIQHSIDLLIQILTGTALALCGLYVVLFFVRGFPLTDLVQMVAATVTSLVPQGLVVMTTVAFLLGAVRLSRRGAVVQRLDAVESMAAVDVLCMDKTGTLTSNRLRLDRLIVLDATLPEAEVRERLRWFAWASVDERSRSIQALRDGLGKPTGPTPEAADQLPFKSQNRYSAVRFRAAEGACVLALGAFEALRPLLAEGAEPAEAAWRGLLPTGLRLLLFAEARGPVPPFQGTLAGAALRPLAVVALSDALRPEAGAVLEALAGQGIAFKILSGDNPETVRATVAGLRLPLAHEPVVTGDQLASAPDRAALVRDRSVFGRVEPRQKLEIIAALRAEGHHVAMLGDGINDLLPIKRADLGIAMGVGAAATRTVAGLVLENDDFGLLPQTLNEGRLIVRNLRGAGKLFILKNVYTLLLVLVAVGVCGLPFPYLPQQVTLLNFLTIGTPAFFITLARGRAAPTSGPSFLRAIGVFALATGTVMGLAGLALFLLSALAWGEPVEMQRTLLLSLLVLLGLANLYRVLPGDGHRLLRLWPVLALMLYAGAMYVPPAASFFLLVPLGAAGWGVVLAFAAPAFLLCLGTDWLGIR